jgi:hypothetical protein
MCRTVYRVWRNLSRSHSFISLALRDAIVNTFVKVVCDSAVLLQG